MKAEDASSRRPGMHTHQSAFRWRCLSSPWACKHRSLLPRFQSPGFRCYSVGPPGISCEWLLRALKPVNLGCGSRECKINNQRWDADYSWLHLHAWHWGLACKICTGPLRGSSRWQRTLARICQIDPLALNTWWRKIHVGCSQGRVCNKYRCSMN